MRRKKYISEQNTHILCKPFGQYGGNYIPNTRPKIIRKKSVQSFSCAQALSSLVDRKAHETRSQRIYLRSLSKTEMTIENLDNNFE